MQQILTATYDGQPEDDVAENVTSSPAFLNHKTQTEI